MKRFLITSLCTFALTLSFQVSHVIDQPLFAQTQSAQAALTQEEIAKDAEASKRVNRLSDQLKSPFCPGKTLMTCTSSQAYDLRQEMRNMIMQGKNDAEILEALRGSFGDSLENPPQPWYTVLVPIMPFILGGVLALVIFSMWLRGSKKKQDEESQKIVPQAKAESREKLKSLMREDD
jgi:cytochrome c-type biogenesis protein CcmH/NrfF